MEKCTLCSPYYQTTLNWQLRFWNSIFPRLYAKQSTPPADPAASSCSSPASSIAAIFFLLAAFILLHTFSCFLFFLDLPHTDIQITLFPSTFLFPLPLLPLLLTPQKHIHFSRSIWGWSSGFLAFSFCSMKDPFWNRILVKTLLQGNERNSNDNFAPYKQHRKRIYVLPPC